MKSRLATTPTLPETNEDNQGNNPDLAPVSLVARFASIKQKLNEDRSEVETAERDKLVAHWFERGVDAHPNRKQLAADIGVSEPYLSFMCHGRKPVPLRALGAMLSHPDCIDALTNAIRADAGLPLAPRRASRVSREQLLEMALAIFIESPGLLRTLINEAGTRYGANAEDVAVALTASK